MYRSYLAAENSRRAEHAAQVRTLLDAHPQAVPDIIKSLPANSDVLDRLRVLWTTPGNQDELLARTRAALALHALVPQASADVRSQLLDWMADAADPQEVLLIRSELSRDAAGLTEGLWKKVEAAQTPREQRFRQLVGLAAFDPSNRRWAELGPELAAALVQTNPLYLPVWTEAFRPVKSALIAPLVAHFSGLVRPTAVAMLPRHCWRRMAPTRSNSSSGCSKPRMRSNISESFRCLRQRNTGRRRSRHSGGKLPSFQPRPANGAQPRSRTTMRHGHRRSSRWRWCGLLRTIASGLCSRNGPIRPSARTSCTRWVRYGLTQTCCSSDCRTRQMCSRAAA